jgi:hypothetical protein
MCAAPTPLPAHDHTYYEDHHSFLILEHEPLLCEEAEKRMVEHLAQAIRQISICIYSKQVAQREVKMPGVRATL